MRRLLLLGIVAYYATSLNAGIANAESHFAGNFFKAVAEHESGNMICSPISTELSVIGAGLGAAGGTLNQIQSVIMNTDTGGMGRIRAFIKSLDSYKDIELRMASNVFVAQGLSLKSRFKSTIQTLFNSKVENIDFSNTVEASKIINRWSAVHTNDRIKDIVTPEGINQDAAVVLINAIYFKGVWSNPFFANETQLRPFHVNGKTIEQVPTMYKLGKYFYGKLPELRASFIEIPYKSHDFEHGISMYIILPDNINGFIELKKNLDKITVEMLRDNADAGEVELFLPKFKIESSLELTTPLIKLGLTDMFSDNANFNGIVENGDLKISKIIQKAFLEVNEEGSEAGAVTGADFIDKKGGMPLARFVVDRPFFSIVATESQVTLFSAVTVDPCDNHCTSLNVGIANAESDFAGNFFKAVAEDESGNMICSPISAELSVIGAGLGAAGGTLNQIQSVIINTDKGGMGRIRAFIKTLDTYKDIELRMVNNVFVAQGLSLKSRFKSTIQTLFNSKVENIDFSNAVEASKIINRWSAVHTNDRIKDIVTPDGIKRDAAVVLINAIYFKGVWSNPFFANETQLRPFHVNGKTIEQVPTMYKLGKYFYGKLPELRASFIEIPYKSHDFEHDISMYIILPDNINGFIELKKNLDKITVEMLRDNADAGEVELFLPKFKIESSLELTTPLIKLGLTDMFSDNANFNGIVENGDLKISKIIQKAFLEVNEEGSEAGAVTEVELTDRMGGMLARFVVDRPFFSIVATDSQVTLFSAVTVDPRNK